MKTIAHIICFTAVALTLAAAPATAEIREFAVHAGSFNATKTPTAAEAGFELRYPTRWPGADFTFGAAGTEDSSFWVYGGARYTFELDRRWGLALGLAVSAYEEGDGKELGGLIAFRSSYEISYQTGERSRLGLLFYHLSNAGIYDRNPGSNSIVLSWSVRSGGARPAGPRP